MAGMRAKLEICGFCREKNVFFSKKIPNDDQYLSTASHRTRLEKHFWPSKDFSKMTGKWLICSYVILRFFDFREKSERTLIFSDSIL